MSETHRSNPAGDEDVAEYVAFDEFHAGLPAGRFRVIVNPDLARPYVKRRLHLLALSMPLIGIGLALALTGHTWAGAVLVLGGVLINRLVTAHAPKIVLHLAARSPSIYADVTANGIMEVRRLTDDPSPFGR